MRWIAAGGEGGWWDGGWLDGPEPDDGWSEVFPGEGCLGLLGVCLVARAESCMSCQPAATGAQTQAIGRDG